MKSLFFLIISSLCIVACQKPAGSGVDIKVAGKWKLTNVKYYYTVNPNGEPGPFSIDYSTENILFDFRKNKTFQVSGNVDDVAGFPDGIYPYEFAHDYLGMAEPGAEKIDLVIIQQTKWVFNRLGSQMSLSTSYFDGPELIFSKVEK